MDGDKPSVIVTGVAGNLGRRLLPHLADYQVIGVDLNPPQTSDPLRFVRMDLGLEESCRDLFLLVREARPVAVIHLAFVLDPVRTGVLDLDRMWQINVAGTARVMEAITEANRNDSIVGRFIFPSSVSVYGPDLREPVSEDCSLRRTHSALCDSQNGIRQGGPAEGTCAARLQRLHATPTYFCRRQRGELYDWSFSRHTQRPGKARRQNAGSRQASSLCVALRTTLSRKPHSVCPRGRHGAVASTHRSPDGARIPAAHGTERGWARRAFDL